MLQLSQLEDLVIPSDREEARNILQDVSDAFLGGHSMLQQFIKGHDIEGLQLAARTSQHIEKHIKRLQRMIEKKKDYDIFFKAGRRLGYQEGVKDAAKEVPEINNFLSHMAKAGAGLTMVHLQIGAQHDSR